MAAEKAAWDDLLQWQREINNKDRQLLRTKAMREASTAPVQETRKIDLTTAEPIGLSALKGKIKAQAPISVKGSANDDKATAVSEKELGNKAFQAQRYDQAIEHYTKAIQLDDQNAIYVINRAMAYLKVERFAEAERDCTVGLKLQPQHVKALFRRGMARRQLGKLSEARTDLEQALKLSTDNGTIKAELDAVILAQTNLKIQPNAAKSSPSTTPTRKLDIQFENTMYSSNQVEQSVTPTTTTPIAPQSSRQFTLPKQPTTMTEFTRDWRMCKSRGNAILYQYMKSIDPKRYGELFKAFLESEHLDQMIEILDQCYDSGQAIKDVLEGLLKVKRIDMLIMFLERKQQEGLKRVFRRMEEKLGQVDQRLRKSWSVDAAT
ncbi:hypothetical protein K450DRAFT_224703 [Umbelopsis ramanniana AG]|uniref:RNA polymerase II-associated protein 3 n=1 Tax=Umbelopsis ramanniana AG TaxID=1314678 RepID=A0AAD5EHA6_UMBRA|nr:uncharacterized protein K450DRAFT_224703 [Umbelopsis ramanniana AG]KAI8583204.1 hypothetical protein K450DRAFT_224703 [Umbelopsis ramanniana AG]